MVGIELLSHDSADLPPLPAPALAFCPMTSANSKPFTLYGDVLPPSPMNVAIVLNELGLEYNLAPVDIPGGEHKGPEFTKLNPNGRIPALVDHTNGDFVIWESGAIILYLVERYDKDKKLSVTAIDDKFVMIQWLFFQTSGQGPYYGQAAWFTRYHPEKIPSAIERYQKEIVRVISVLDSVLSKQDWLVGGKVTVADLCFVPWNEGALNMFLNGLEVDVQGQYPSFYKWHKALTQRPVVAKFMALQAQRLKEIQDKA
ncbi:glutathione S-transferase C-terminal-like protein [Cubamyces menziesii]|nr:glutathione S-transferase C-terminal-like protein [Cubamyces menziesii]